MSAPKIYDPATLAHYTASGKWWMAPHLEFLNRAVYEACWGIGPDRLIVTMPPRHGKSEFCSKYTPAWFLNQWPDKRVILSSYEADFAAGWGLKARELIDQNSSVLGVSVSKASNARDRWDIAGRDGGMVTAGVGGAITGKGAHLLLIDDPVKNSEQADSPTYRAKAWDWWQSTASTRIEPGGVAIVIQTRWHEDDLAGRLIEDNSENWRVINFPAMAEGEDILGRSEGQALWPQRYDEAALERIKRRSGSRWWSALYQQRPTAAEGDMFLREWFETVPHSPDVTRMDGIVRYWDKAGTQGGSDYSCGLLMCRVGSMFYVMDVVHGQWSSDARNKIMLETARQDHDDYGGQVVTWVEQEPGSGGKESAEFSVKLLAGHTVKVERVTGDKVTRARPLASQYESGNVRLCRAAWNRDYIDEMAVFPNGAHDDRVDGSSGAFNKLSGSRETDLASWLEAGAF